MALPVIDDSEKRQPKSIIHPIFGSCRLNEGGYWRINSGPKRNMYLHRAVWEATAGRPVPQGFEVHHMGPKLCACPHNLVALQKELHVRPEPLRCPNTGEFLSLATWLRRFGVLPERFA